MGWQTWMQMLPLLLQNWMTSPRQGGGEKRLSGAENKRKDENEKEGVASRHALEENIHGNRMNATRIDGIEAVTSTSNMIAGVS